MPTSPSTWRRATDDQLLDMRFSDLGLRIEGTALERRIAVLYDELAERGLRFRPHCWLSNEWFSPDGVPGIAVPFYLAHPRLARLEANMMFEVEGGNHDWCMQLLRHETGHAYETAFRLHRRKEWKRLFGDAKQEYPEFYNPKPFSRRYVLHLDWWYAQSHPSEDFAETFAVWLRPGSKWQRRYAGWPALRKLEYVDRLMTEVEGTTAPVRTRRRVDALSSLRMTLREHYQEKRQRYGGDYPDFYDRDLRRLFADGDHSQGRAKASAFLRRVSPEVRRVVSDWTGEHAYMIDQVLKEMISRCRALNLRVSRPPDRVKLEAAVLVTMMTMNYLHSSDHRLAL